MGNSIKASDPATIFDPTKSFDDNFDHGPYPSLSKQEPYENSGEPAYSFLGQSLYSPFGVGAGSMPTSRHLKYAFERGFDVLVYKTQRSVPFPANDFPNVVYPEVEGDLTLEKASRPLIGHLSSDKPLEELTITNSFGNPSRGPEFWLEDMKQAIAAAGKGQLLIAGVVGTIKPGFSQDDYYQDFADTAALADSTGVKAIEINFSCPNVATEGVICYTPEAVISISEKARKIVPTTPLIGKLGYFSADQEELLEEIVLKSSPYLNAYSAINTIPAAIVDEKGMQLLKGEGRLKSGVCGVSIKWAGLDMVRRLAAIREKHGLDYEIIGIGGVAGPEDVKEYLDAGATVVQSVTAAMWNDQLGAEVKAAL